MAFPSGFLDELRSRLLLSSVVGRKVRLARAGREYKAPCPFHNEKTPSFYINDQKGFFHCFGCGAHGDVIGFTMRIANLAFPEALEQLAAEAGLEVPRPSAAERQQHERHKSLHDLLEQATVWFGKQLYAPAGRQALEYLRGRGLDDEAIARFRLGYAPADGSALRQALASQKFPAHHMLEAGILKQPEDGREPYSFFRNRVIFPVADRRGRVVAFGGRLIEGDGPKYINSPDTPLFHKGSLLYGLSRARQAAADGQPVIVAEGYMDVIALVRAGFQGAVAPLGTALTETQLDVLWKLYPMPPRIPVLCLDGDSAGQKAAFRAVERAIPLLKPDQSLRVAFLPQGEDPDSLIRKRGAEAMKSVLESARPLADVLWDMETARKKTDTPEGKAGLRQALEQQVSRIADPAVQSFYRQDLRRRLDAAFGWRPAARFSGPGKKPTPAASRGPVTRVLPVRAQQQRERVLLATLLRYPALFAEVAESLASVSFDPGPAENLRAALVGLLEANPDLETAALRHQLEGMGLAQALQEAVDSGAGIHARFASASASEDEAREGWLHTWDLLRREQLKKDMDRARETLAQDMDAEKLARLVLLGDEMRQGSGGTDSTDPQ
ncbi:MAG: DNA primase [Pseudomonadota bacterium]|nr:DNA primase [Pseudomonadota bacterium]